MLYLDTPLLATPLVYRLPFRYRSAFPLTHPPMHQPGLFVDRRVGIAAAVAASYPQQHSSALSSLPSCCHFPHRFSQESNGVAPCTFPFFETVPFGATSIGLLLPFMESGRVG